MIIALGGKGGTGKTTIAGLLVHFLRKENKGPVLAIDADPNENLGEVLGLKPQASIVGILDELSEKKDQLPAGMTKERYIEYRLEEAVQESKGLDLLVMGRPEGPGCYCYVNTLLRDLISRFSRQYPFIVIDNAAGMEHLSRRTERKMDILVLVSDYSILGIRAALKIYELAKGLKIKIGRSFLIINKATDKIDSLEREISASGDINLAGVIPYDEDLIKAGIENKSIESWSREGQVMRESFKIFRRMLCL